MKFNKESDFEGAFVQSLIEHGWHSEGLNQIGLEPILNYPTEQELIDNWRKILFLNNRQQDCLNEQPLTDSEMQQILDKVYCISSPFQANKFINEKEIRIKRDNPDDNLNFGKEVVLYNFSNIEIAAGRTIYQIAEQPIFDCPIEEANNSRGDVLLLINGMPVIHIELKSSKRTVIEAYYQIKRYAHNNIFKRIFSLIQVFVAMTPEETLYFANPGTDTKFNEKFVFHWHDNKNVPINEWKQITSTLLSIPMAHEMIAYYTIADDNDKVLKVMRSYQYHAASKIFDTVSKMDWNMPNQQRGGVIWHTTGSGKTMTSFKSAQLIANNNKADKVVFLIDRTELGTQSFGEYLNFSQSEKEIVDTKSTRKLLEQLKHSNSSKLIITSIQKMSILCNYEYDEDSENETLDNTVISEEIQSSINLQESNDTPTISNEQKKSEVQSKKKPKRYNATPKDLADLENIKKQRIVFIIDEAHRSTFGKMLCAIKNVFSNAVFFGFTGTPIFEQNFKLKNITTTSIFGDILHKYTLANGIKDKNVLGFDVIQCAVKEQNVRNAVIFEQTKSNSLQEIFQDRRKKAIYDKIQSMKMYGEYDENKKYTKGVEDLLPPSQYKNKKHRIEVINDILDNWIQQSCNYKFHGLLATTSIDEAFEYYKDFKEILSKDSTPEELKKLKISVLVDPNLDNKDSAIVKQDNLIEILRDYNNLYNTSFSLKNYDEFKKNITARLAHKKPLEYINGEPEKHINILIVVDQLLTGFDSPYLAMLYLDKVIKYELLIQAFSRTNRLLDDDKKNGIICYYRKPYTMKHNIEKAVNLYSNNEIEGLFVQKLDKNIYELNGTFLKIKSLFVNNNVQNFAKNVESKADRHMFVREFNSFQETLKSAQIQGFTWDKKVYKFSNNENSTIKEIEIIFDKKDYFTLVQRYKELQNPIPPSPAPKPAPDDEYFLDFKSSITSISTEKIDQDYIESKFKEFIQTQINSEDFAKKEQVLKDLHASYAYLSTEKQDIAKLIIHEIERNEIQVNEDTRFMDLITERIIQKESNEINNVAIKFGLNGNLLREMLNKNLSESNINQLGAFDKLKETVDKEKAKNYLETLTGISIPQRKINIKIDKVLRGFILNKGGDIDIIVKKVFAN